MPPWNMEVTQVTGLFEEDISDCMKSLNEYIEKIKALY